MAAARPLAAPTAVLAAAEAAAGAGGADDWREAFRHHPRIGERAAERRQSAAAQALSAREQSAVQQASESDLAALADGNRGYEGRFGDPYIVDATRRAGAQVLRMLSHRL